MDSSSDNSTKSCRLIRPRVGGSAVTTSSVSPASGSTSRCIGPGLANGTLTLANFGIGDVPLHQQRQRRRLDAVGKGQRPLRAVGAAFAFERGHLRPVEPDADGLAFLQRQPADIADDGAAFGADRLDVDRRGLIEHQPHIIGAAEQRGRRRRVKGERHTQAVAVAPRLDRAFCRRTGCDRRHLLRRLRGRRSGVDLLGGLRRFRGLHGLCRFLGRSQHLLPCCRRIFRRRRGLLGDRRRHLRCRWRLRRLSGLDLDPGLLCNHLRGDRRKLRRLLRRHRHTSRFITGQP